MKKLLILPFLLIVISLSYAQDTELRILDLSMHPTPNSTLTPNDNSVDIQISFKLNKPENAASVKFCLGTAPSLCDILDDIANIFYKNGDYYLEYQNVQEKIVGYKTFFSFRIPKEALMKLNIKIYVNDKNGQKSNELLYSIR